MRRQNLSTTTDALGRHTTAEVSSDVDATIDPTFTDEEEPEPNEI
jgi:hypothetical protein